MLVNSFQQIFKVEYFYQKYPQHIDLLKFIKILYDVTNLLFSCEVNRNPEALISNIIFQELIKRGVCSIK
jgi:hypothetical protein